MSDSKPLSPSQANPHSRSLTPRQEYTPSPPRRSPRKNNSRNRTPPREKRYRSRSPDHSPLRKYPRRSRSNSRSPSHDRYDRYDRYHRRDRGDRYERYDDIYGPSDRYNRFDRYDRYDPYDRRDIRDRYADRDSRRRYYSPERRSPPERHSPPPRHRDYSRDSDPAFVGDRYRPRHRDESYRDGDYDRRWSRTSDRSSSRSPRRRRDRRRRDRRRRDREPVSPSQRIPAEKVDQLFLEALKLVVKYRRPPFNISVISDYMSSINQQWSVRKTQYPTFSDLCRVQESRGHLVLARQGESVVMLRSKYQPDVLEVRPKDMGRRRRNRDRGQDDDNRIDRTSRRDWDFDERAQARKERFRENGDVQGTNTNAKLEPKRSKDQDIGEGSTRAVSKPNRFEKASTDPIEGLKGHTETLKNADVDGIRATGATSALEGDGGNHTPRHSSRTPPDVYDGIGRAEKRERRTQKANPSEGKDLRGFRMCPGDEREGDASEAVNAGVSRKRANDDGEKEEAKQHEVMVKGRDEATTSAIEQPAES